MAAPTLKELTSLVPQSNLSNIYFPYIDNAKKFDPTVYSPLMTKNAIPYQEVERILDSLNRVIYQTAEGLEKYKASYLITLMLDITLLVGSYVFALTTSYSVNSPKFYIPCALALIAFIMLFVFLSFYKNNLIKMHLEGS